MADLITQEFSCGLMQLNIGTGERTGHLTRHEQGFTIELVLIAAQCERFRLRGLAGSRFLVTYDPERLDVHDCVRIDDAIDVPYHVRSDRLALP